MSGEEAAKSPVTAAPLRWLVPPVVPLLVGLVQMSRLLLLLRLPEATLVGCIPDDAFYYLTLSRNFARLGRWTADGVEPASGFHLLWGYLLAAVYRVAPDISFHAIFTVAGTLQIGFMATAAWLACRTARRVFGTAAELGVAVIFLSAISLSMGLNMMETSLVLLASAATCDALCREQPGGFTLPLAFALGLAGTLARSDFFFLPLSFVAIHLVLRICGRTTIPMLRRSIATVVGAFAGVALIAAHTLWISGQWLQSSVQMKLHWSKLAGPSVAPVRTLLLAFFDFGSVVYNHPGSHRQWSARIQTVESFLGATLILILIAALLLPGRRARTAPQAMTIGALGASIAAFTGVYFYTSAALFAWYIGQFEVPIALLAGAACSLLIVRFRKTTIAACIGVSLCGIIPTFTLASIAPNRLYAVADYVRAHPDLKPIGIWNSGVIGYFAGGGVVNLDGLVNDRIFPYAQAGNLSQYVAARGIQNILDYPFMFNGAFAAQGGYSDGILRSCLTTNDPQLPEWGSSEVGSFTLYRIMPGCLEAKQNSLTRRAP